MVGTPPQGRSCFVLRYSPGCCQALEFERRGEERAGPLPVGRQPDAWVKLIHGTALVLSPRPLRLSARYSFRQKRKTETQLTKADFLRRCGSERLRWANNCRSSLSALSSASICRSFASIWDVRSSISTLLSWPLVGPVLAGFSSGRSTIQTKPWGLSVLWPSSTPLRMRLRTVSWDTPKWIAASAIDTCMAPPPATMVCRCPCKFVRAAYVDCGHSAGVSS